MTTNIVPLPMRADFLALAQPKASKPKDATAAERQRRHRAKQKAAEPVTATIVTLPSAVTPPTLTPEPAITVTAVTPEPAVTAPTVTPEPAVAVTAPPPAAAVPPHVPPAVLPGVDAAAYFAAIALAGVAAWFSVRGMVVLFPGSPVSVVFMASAMEAAKLVTAAWLAARWGVTPWIARLVLMFFVGGIALINGVGVFSQLVSAHVGERGAAQAAVETADAALVAKIEVAASKVADLDRQIAAIDSAVAAATQKGNSKAGLSAIEGQRQTRAGLAGERERAAGTLATLKAERAGVASKAHQQETEAAPIRYVAELVGATSDSEQAIRWLILLMVLTCDPLAIALTAAASAQRGRTA
jgi:hypothetical protein